MTRIGPTLITKRTLSTTPVWEAGNGLLVMTERLLETVAVNAGLGWGGGIIATTLVLRSALTLPLVVNQLKLAARLELEAKPQVEAWRERIKGEIFREMRDRGIRSYRGLAAPPHTTGADHQKAPPPPPPRDEAAEVDVEGFQKEFESKVRSKALEVYREHGYRPVKSLLLPLAQIPLWVTLSLTLRRLTASPLPFGLETLPAPIPALHDAGFLWFTDLTLPDSTWVFPLIVGSSYLLNVEVRPA